jgi:hypothetical protein
MVGIAFADVFPNFRIFKLKVILELIGAHDTGDRYVVFFHKIFFVRLTRGTN